MITFKKRVLSITTAIAVMAVMCLSGAGTLTASAAETGGAIETASPIVIITGTDFVGGDEYNEETLAKERVYTLDDLKAIANADTKASTDNLYWHSGLNTQNSTSIYRSEGVRLDAVFEDAGVTSTDATYFEVEAQDRFVTPFDPSEEGLGQKESTYTSQSLSKARYFYPNIGKLNPLIEDTDGLTASELTKEQVAEVEEDAVEVPTIIAWARAGSKNNAGNAYKKGTSFESLKAKIEESKFERWDDEGDKSVQLIVGALDARDYNNPVWNGDTGCLTIIAGDDVEEELITINGKGYTRTQFMSQPAEVRAYTYQRNDGLATKYAKGIMVSNLIKQFNDTDIIKFKSADTNEFVRLTKKELVEGNYMLAYEAGNSSDSLEPIYEVSDDGTVKGFFSLYGDDVRPAKFINEVSVLEVPDTPENFKAARSTSTSISLTWDAVEGAEGYRIYRASTENGTYGLLKELEGGEISSYKDEGIPTGDKYYYKITAYGTDGGINVESSMSVSVYATVTPEVPGSFKATRSSHNSIKLTWTKVSGADGYYIYRYNSSKKIYSLYKRITSGNTTSYTNTGLITGTTYKYYIKAYSNGNNGTVSSLESSVKSAYPYLTKPTIKKLTAGKKRITVKWNKITGATGYKVYRA
ncbi:MAG: fibronectin type III domain-containing protein, partial [Firmicutes bacterium]|nr:fibronectin type III domain-containing protein [Bacillota bacterium]